MLNHRRDARVVGAVVLACLALYGVGLGWGLPNYADWAVDTVAAFRVLQGLERQFTDGWFDRYPPLHLFLLAVLYTPYLLYLLAVGAGPPAFWMEQPLHALHATGSLILISRVVSAVMAAGAVLLVYHVGRRLFSHEPAIFASLIVGFNHHFVYYAHAANLDVPYLFWFLLSLVSYLRVLEGGAPRDYMLFALFATLAVCTKDQAYALYALSPLPILWIRWRERPRAERPGRRFARVLLDRRNGLAILVALTGFVLVHNLVFNGSGFLRHAAAVLERGETTRQFERSPAGWWNTVRATAVELSRGMTPPIFVASLLGAAYWAFRAPRKTLPLLALALSYVASFLCVVLQVYGRFVLPIAVILGLFGGKVLAAVWRAAPTTAPATRRGGSRLISMPRTVRAVARAAIVAALAYELAFAVQVDALLLRDARFAAEAWLEEHTRPDDLVETFAAAWAVESWYPRFPDDVKVRSSWLGAGTAWKPYEENDRLDIPNVYFGGEDPDYIVLSELWANRVRRWNDPPERRGLDDLLAGRMGFVKAAEFRTVPVLPIHLPLNPPIVIFRRRAGAERDDV